MNRSLLGFATLSLLALACGQTEGHEAPRGAATAPVEVAAPAATTVSSPAPASASASVADDEVPREKFGDGERAFAKVKETLLRNYYAEGIGEDELYRAATAGMLEKLEPKMKKWNRLFSPREVGDLKSDLRGEVVGVGVQIEFDEKSGYADVSGTLPGSPAEKARLVRGDKIITVDGKLYKGMRLRDVLADIRGKAGEPVKLSVLRDGKLLDVTLVRERVAFDQPTSALLPDGVGYVSIPSFTDKTPAAVRAALEELARKAVKALIVDMRSCPGGSFDRAIETTELFLPAKTPIVTLRRRQPAAGDQYVAKGQPVLAEVPVVVLVDGNTTSGAEFFTTALQEGRHARTVGERTMGKWSVQSIDDLPNGFAFKYTVSLFFTPSGKTYDGVGLMPDVLVSLDPAARARAAAAARIEDRLALDAQLRTAKELLVAR